MGRQGRRFEPDKGILGSLTPSQLRIVKMTFTGVTDEQIAYLCGISVQTVKNQLYNAYRATGARNRPHLAALVWWELEGKESN